ncbi:MAG: MBL fold metallo-hydrolase [Bacillota bacterium]|nr:MBL fold metallo-hydrolase [Bacillota bacterium]
MKITEGIHTLDLPMKMPGMETIIYPTLIWDEENVVLVDTGLPGQLDLIKAKMEKLGVSFEKLKMVIITHQDMDHIGCLSAIQRELGDKIQVVAHSLEKPYLEFEKMPIKMTADFIAQVSERIKAANGGISKTPKEVFASKVNKTVEDGEELNVCGGMQVIFTPGHTPGHISIYHKKSGTMIAGDVLSVVDGQLYGPDPRFTYDMDLAKNSLKKLEKYDIKTLICYHGGEFDQNPNESISRIAKDN